MNQNISITVTIIIAFIVSFTILFFYMNYYSETLNNINNQQILETPNKNYILIFGSSYVGALNLPHIENKLNDEGQQYVVPKITSYAIEHTEKLIPKISIPHGVPLFSQHPKSYDNAKAGINKNNCDEMDCRICYS